MGTCVGQLISAIVCLVILGAIGFGVWWALGKPESADEAVETVKGIDFGDFSDVLDNLGNFEDIWDQDPYLSSNATYSWDNGNNQQGGLQLELLNALDDNWYDHFNQAVSDWDSGNPDALTLTTSIVDVDHDCTPVDGVMKVCNGNYGETGWLGINEIIQSTSASSAFILNSVAKMNEYYLMNAEEDERQYTMCHEIGHGFGLPHTDENFDNADLGNCLDYTRRPGDNKTPDATNYARLASLYGVVGQRRLNTPSHGAIRQTKQFSQELLQLHKAAMANFDISRIPDVNEDAAHHNGWRKLESRQGGGRYSTKLDEDYTLEVYALFSDWE